MAVNEESTGGPLTRRVRREADINDPNAVRELMDRKKINARSSKNYVKAIASHCAELLKERGIDPDPRGLPEAAEAAGYEHPSPEWHIAEIVRLAYQIEGQIDVENPWAAVRFAIQLGRMDVLGAIGPYDQNAARFEQVSERQASANKAKADCWRIPAQQAAKEIWTNKPNLSASAVAKRIESFKFAEGISHRTIRGAIAKVRANKSAPE